MKVNFLLEASCLYVKPACNPLSSIVALWDIAGQGFWAVLSSLKVKTKSNWNFCYRCCMELMQAKKLCFWYAILNCLPIAQLKQAPVLIYTSNI